MFDSDNYTVSTPNGRTIHSKVYYDCREGYNLTNGSGKRYCTPSYDWNNKPPVCELIGCGFPHEPNSATIELNDTTYLHEAYYLCHHDFILDGPSVRYCQANGTWSGPDPDCLADCLQPSYSYLSSVYTPDGTLTGAEAFYNCTGGYTVVGNSSRLCQYDGLWSGIEPSCQPHNCSVLSNPSNGFVTFSSVSYMSMANYSCSVGYMLQGVENRTCNMSELWSEEEPHCLPIKCVTQNGEYSTEDENDLDDVLCCEEGFLVNTSDIITGFVITSHTCLKVDCGNATIDKGNVTVFQPTNAADRVAYACHDGYVLNVNGDRFCQTNGSYNGTKPVCQPKDCGNPPGIFVGTLAANGTTYGDVVTYKCLLGYGLVGTEFLTCSRFGVWDGLAPICVPISKSSSQLFRR